MHRVLAIGLTVLLSGCGFSSAVIRSEALDFGEVIEDTTNKLLVINVLRARDKAPLHDADLRHQPAAFQGFHHRDHLADRPESREILAGPRPRPEDRAAAVLLGGG